MWHKLKIRLNDSAGVRKFRLYAKIRIFRSYGMKPECLTMCCGLTLCPVLL
jgi:hypothetical protein